MKVLLSCWKTIYSFAALTLETFLNYRRGISRLHAAMWYFLYRFNVSSQCALAVTFRHGLCTQYGCTETNTANVRKKPFIKCFDFVANIILRSVAWIDHSYILCNFIVFSGCRAKTRLSLARNFLSYFFVLGNVR